MQTEVEKAVTGASIAALRRLLGLSRWQKRLLVFGIDAALCILSVYIAFSLRLGEWFFWSDGKAKLLAVAFVTFPVFFTLTGVYRAIFRYAGSGMMLGLARSVAIYTVPVVTIFGLWGVPGVPRTLSLIQPLVFFALLVMSRITARYIFVELLKQRNFSGDLRSVLLYGAGAAGQQLAASIRHDPGMALVAYIDDDKRLDGQTLNGVKIYHSAKLPDLIARGNVTNIILALPNITRSKRKRIVTALQKFPVHVQTVPNVNEIVAGRFEISDVREIRIEELLGRDPVPPNELLLGKTIVGKTVLVTGAGGSIGSELSRQIARIRPAVLILFEMTEHALYQIEQEVRQICEQEGLSQVVIVPEMGSVVDSAAIRRLFSTYRPNTVFHAAAYKHVPLVEANPLAGLRNNVFGTLEIAQACRQFGVDHCILISTDKAVRPTNVMGASKRVAELVMQAMAEEKGHTRFAMVRFGNVLGSSGSVVPLFRKQIREGRAITLTHHDVTRYFMTIPEAAQLVIQAGAMAEGGEVFVLDMGKPVRIRDLAVTMIKLSGLTVRDAAHPDGDIEIVETGLRPGEKLYEELLIGDNPEPTKHKRILRAKEQMLPWQELQPKLEALLQHAKDGDVARTLAIVHELVPEYGAGDDLPDDADEAPVQALHS